MKPTETPGSQKGSSAKMAKILYVELEDLSDERLLCTYRGIAHRWDENPGVDLPDTDRTYYCASVLAQVCERCGREKFEFFDLHNQRMGKPYYRYPVGYQRTHKLTSHEVRLELIARGLMVTTYKKGISAKARKELRQIQRTNASA